ncbi:hypothetical protein [Rathayibacter sp. AY1A7]|uniref:hypothetical protein n=1 Tax=Rathayibacter sp. AY1A7 TaxID=2080524 RepID=UPI0011B07E91|nr:hypothetical protein [Rathayibacter sp. AY1A7]
MPSSEHGQTRHVAELRLPLVAQDSEPRIWTTADDWTMVPRSPDEAAHDLYTLSAAAKRIRKRRATIRAWIQQGLLDYYQREGDHTKYVKLSELQAAYLNRLTALRSRPRDDDGRFTPWT